MFKKKRIEDLQVSVSICADVLETVFDECDKSSENETGGRIIGFYEQHKNELHIKACGVIGPGPNSRQSPTSFFQDGEYQESVFRKIEERYPDVEHLGNWHTHHVNGLNTLSQGDIGTYMRIVNHQHHNTDFFYALLVVAKKNGWNRERYVIKHFLFRRGKQDIHVIDDSQVKILKESGLFIDRSPESISDRVTDSTPSISSRSSGNSVRAIDKEIISALFPSLRTYFSAKANSVYWRGNITLIDNTSVEVIILESVMGGKLSYSIALRGKCAELFRSSQLYIKRSYDSAWKAVCSLERDLNREIFGEFRNGNSIGR